VLLSLVPVPGERLPARLPISEWRVRTHPGGYQGLVLRSATDDWGFQVS
jgi:hypothetical protein